jgi:nucleoside-diphosphate-sugar epimerase
VPKKFSNAYAETKFLAEQVVASNHSSSFQTVSLRPRAVIGRGDKNILPRLVQLQKSGGLIQVGNGENLVDFTSVQNLIDAIILCLRAPAQALGGAYNISNGEPIRFWDFVDLLLKEMSQQRKIKKLPYAFVMALALANEKLAKIFRSPKEPALLPITVGVLHYSMTLDISRARKNLHYSSQQNTLSAIKEWLGK